MNKFNFSLISLFFIVLISSCTTNKLLLTEETEAEIMGVLEAQQNAWNEGNIDEFMKGYWKSDQLTFTGSRGVTYGWEETLYNYKKGYPNKEVMGKLQFDVIELRPLSKDTYHMIGKFTLFREADTPSGYFTLIWKKIDGQFYIISDHTS